MRSIRSLMVLNCLLNGIISTVGDLGGCGLFFGFVCFFVIPSYTTTPSPLKKLMREIHNLNSSSLISTKHQIVFAGSNHVQISNH